MNQSKYISNLQALEKKGIFSSAEGEKMGIPPRMLVYFCQKSHIERVSRGFYRVKDPEFGSDFEWEDLAITVLSIPKGVICLISALCYYELTDEIMREFWIAVPHSTSAPNRENTRITRMRNTTLGQGSVKIGNQKIKIFNRERTIVDAFRYLDKETSLKALQRYLNTQGENKPDIDKLLKYAKRLRVDLKPYISAFTL